MIKRFAWFSNEILFTNARLQQLGMEAENVVTEVKKMYKESGEESGEGLMQFENMVINAKKGVLGNEIKDKCTSERRCRYWNRGYCREGTTKCPFHHPPDDCQQHLLEGRCSSQGCGQRHRKRCKYWGTPIGCFRKGQCQYLHMGDPNVSTDSTESKEVEVEEDIVTEYNTPNYENKKKDKYISVKAKEPEKASNDNVEKEASDLVENTQLKLFCYICKYTSKNNNMMKKHLNSKHKDHLKCLLCDSKFSSAAAAAECCC